METRFQPGSEAKPAQLGARKSLRRFPFLALTTGLAFSLFLPGGIFAQDLTPAPNDVDSGKVQPLDLKPGCWEVRWHSSMVGRLHTPEEWEQRLTPAQRAAFTPQRVHQLGADASENEKKAAEELNKGGETTTASCTLAPFIDVSKEVYGTSANQCGKTIEASGQTRHIHVACPVLQNQQATDDYERTDAQHFKGTQHRVMNVVETDADHGTLTTVITFVGKWISEAAPHLPYAIPTTDVNGVRPKGSFAIAWLDRFRIVAIIEGKQVLARNAYFLANSSDEDYGPRPLDALQQIYLHHAIAYEAVKLHLDQQEPWRHQLNGPVGPGVVFDPGNPLFCSECVVDVSSSEHDSTADVLRRGARTRDPLERILWNAYFSQAPTEAEKQALLRREQEKYKITVTDPDFFAGTTRPPNP